MFYYTEEFRLEVVQSVQTGKFTKDGARRHFGIKGKSTVLGWLRLYEKYGFCHVPLSYRILNSLATDMSRHDKNQVTQASEVDLTALPNDVASLQKLVKEMKRKLSDAELKAELFEEIIHVAEAELKISIRKKYNTK